MIEKARLQKWYVAVQKWKDYNRCASGRMLVRCFYSESGIETIVPKHYKLLSKHLQGDDF